MLKINGLIQLKIEKIASKTTIILYLKILNIRNDSVLYNLIFKTLHFNFNNQN